MKDVIWLGDTRKVMQGFPTAVKHAVGVQLMMVQAGLDPMDWKPIKTIGPGVREIRVRVGGAYRVIYTTQYENAVYVLYVFEKKSQKTSKPDIDMAKQRLAELRRIVK
jgi:phage-related protein